MNSVKDYSNEFVKSLSDFVKSEKIKAKGYDLTDAGINAIHTTTFAILGKKHKKWQGEAIKEQQAILKQEMAT